MAVKTSIQWTDSTVNPVMGCEGCELWPSPRQVCTSVDEAIFNATGATANYKAIVADVVKELYAGVAKPPQGVTAEVTTSAIWQTRKCCADKISERYGTKAGKAAADAIAQALTCYSAKLTCNKGWSPTNPGRQRNKGYAVTFEQVTEFPGRTAIAAGYSDLLGQRTPLAPWKGDLARMLFVSDMGDALSSKKQFEFLRQDTMPAITSAAGQRHLWQWLTKRPSLMADFAESVGGFPPNLCAMTTVTNVATLHRIDDLRKVNAACRGLSIEPLWERIPPELLNLDGIHLGDCWR